MRFSQFAVLLLIFLLLGFYVRFVLGWSNGGFSSNPSSPDYGTHDWIAHHALDWLPYDEKIFILDNLAVYLYGTELPDNSQASDGIGDTTKHHVYYFANGSLQDDASAVRAQQEFDNALSLYLSGDIPEAVKRLGAMTHYIADVAVFGHVMAASTDWGNEIHHSDYETYVNERTNSYYDDFNYFFVFDGVLESISAYDATLKLAFDTTFDVDGDYTCVWMDTNYNWSDPTFRGRCGESLNLAVNLVADVLHTFYLEIIAGINKVHDLAVLNITLPSHYVYAGEEVNITVYFKNEGTVSESIFPLTVSVNSIFNESIWFLGVGFDPGEIWSYNFTWNTHGVQAGNYTVTATIEPLSEEYDTADNLAYGWLYIWSEDNEPPEILSLEQTPTRYAVEPYQNVTISVSVRDYKSGVELGILHYSVNGSAWINITMSMIPTDCGVYFLQATIPGFDAGTEVQYWVSVHDYAGNTATEDNHGKYYHYTIVPEFSSYAIAIMFLALTLLAVLLRRRRRSP